MRVAPAKAAKPCCSCGKLTKYSCLDCLIDGREFIALCENPQCKEKHKVETRCFEVRQDARIG